MDAQRKEESARIDIWIWAVRLYKTRSIAASACKKSQVLINGSHCKPSRHVRAGDRVEVTRGLLTLTVEVKGILNKRIGAKLIGDYLIDHTPEEVYRRASEIAQRKRQSAPKREAGAGRPTKRERRELEELEAYSADDLEAFEKLVRAIETNG